MEIVKQLAIFLENKPGALLRLTQDLVSMDINILGMSVTDSIDHAVVRMIVDKPTEAIHLMGEAGVLVLECDLVRVTLRNRPGELQKFCQKLADENINIEYAYGSSPTRQQEADLSLYVRVLEPAKFVEKVKI